MCIIPYGSLVIRKMPETSVVWYLVLIALLMKNLDYQNKQTPNMLLVLPLSFCFQTLSMSRHSACQSDHLYRVTPAWTFHSSYCPHNEKSNLLNLALKNFTIWPNLALLGYSSNSPLFQPYQLTHHYLNKPYLKCFCSQRLFLSS